MNFGLHWLILCEHANEYQRNCWTLELLAEDLKPMVTISSATSLYEAVQRLQQNNIHRLLVVDELTDEALYILTNRRIVHFVWYFVSIF